MKLPLKKILLGTTFSVVLLTAPLAQARVILATDEDYCREYTQTFTVGGETQKGYGTACLQPDGSWEIQQPASNTVVINGQPQPNVQYIVRDNRVIYVPVRPFSRVMRPLVVIYHDRYDHHFDDRYMHGRHRHPYAHD